MRKEEHTISTQSLPTNAEAVGTAPIGSVRLSGQDASGMKSKNSTFNESSRLEVIERNLKDGLDYIEAQDRNLALIGDLLDQFRYSLGNTSESPKCRKTTIRLMHEVFVQGYNSVQLLQHRGYPLFDDGTSSPLKFHVLRDGLREVIDVFRANLFGPALSALALCPSDAPPGEPIVLEAIREIVELRTATIKSRSNITIARDDVLARIRSRNSARSLLYGFGKKSKRLNSVSTASPSPLISSPDNYSSRGVRLLRKFFSNDASLSEI
jgi:hypothetical protein